MNMKDLKAEFRLTCDGDCWGSVMLWWFAIADELHFNRDSGVPSSWQFRPSPLGPSNDLEAYETEIVEAADTETLLRFGELMNRCASRLKRLGKDY